MQTLGTQLLLELMGCDPDRLNDPDKVGRILMDAAEAAGATILHHTFKTFEPQGVSGVVIIAESHLSIHTWPEFGYAAVDIFTGGNRVHPQRSVSHIIKHMHPSKHRVLQIGRGPLEEVENEQGEASC